MTDNDEPEIETKKLFNVEISNLEIAKIRMVCDYIILDRFSEVSSFPRFEKCFGPLFSKENPKFLVEVFKEICGEKKKYISFRRMILAYIKWKSGNSKIENFNKFMDKLFNKIIKESDENIGNAEEGQLRFSTRTGRPRKVITKFGVKTDEKKNIIKGFYLQYDECFDAFLSKEKKMDDITLEINMLMNNLGEKVTRKNFTNRDGISHIAGKYSITNKVIKFLIFKCRSGKTFYIGDINEEENENIEIFLLGTSTCQLKTLRVELVNNTEQLAFLEPKFQPSISFNQNLNRPFEEIDENYLNEKQLIFEENELQNYSLEQLDEINNILIPCIKDDHFIDINTLKEEKDGKKFEEIYESYLCSNKNKKEENAEPKKDEEILVNANEKRRKSMRSTIETLKKYNMKKKLNFLLECNENIKMDHFLAKIVKLMIKTRKKGDKADGENDDESEETFEEEIENEEELDKNAKPKNLKILALKYMIENKEKLKDAEKENKKESKNGEIGDKENNQIENKENEKKEEAKNEIKQENITKDDQKEKIKEENKKEEIKEANLKNSENKVIKENNLKKTIKIENISKDDGKDCSSCI